MSDLPIFTDDPLAMDIAGDLERVDGVMTQVINDPITSEEFRRDPNGVLVRLGMHPPTTPDVNERVNRVFYAVMTNRPLLEFIIDHYRGFNPANSVEYAEHHLAGLDQGRLQNRLALDLEGADHLLRDAAALREVYRLMLHDLNDRRILQRTYTAPEIDEYIDQLVEAVTARRAIADHPKLEVWDRNYGIGNHYGTGCAEVGPAVTVAAGAEVVVAVTVAIPVGILGLGPQVPSDAGVGATLGDPDALRRFATMNRVLHFAGELLTHTHRFESAR